MRIILLLVSFVSFSAVQAAVINFEDLPSTEKSLVLSTGGFTFNFLDPNGTGSHPELGFGVMPTNNYSVCYLCFAPGLDGGVGFEFYTNSGNAFSISSMDYLVISAMSATNVTFAITGHLAGGGVLSSEIFIPDVGLPAVVQNYSFDASWNNLTKVSIFVDSTSEVISAGAAAFDNIQVSVVPIPAGFWLFGSALAGIGWMRKKQTA